MEVAGARVLPAAGRQQGPQEVLPAHPGLGPAQPHRAVLRQQDARQDQPRRTSRRYIADEAARRSRSRRSATTSTRCTRSSSSGCGRGGAPATPSSSPTARPTTDPKAETDIRFLDQDELEQLLAAPYPDDAWGSVEPTLYLTAAMTGLRQGELLGLRWRDVDFDAQSASASCRTTCAASSTRRSPRSPAARCRWPRRSQQALLRPPWPHRLRAQGRPRVLPPRHRTAARPLEADPPLQAGAGTGRGPPDHLPRAAPHVRHHDGRRRRSRCARSRTGWATTTSRPPRSTPTTEPATTRSKPSIEPSRDPSGRIRSLGLLVDANAPVALRGQIPLQIRPVEPDPSSDSPVGQFPDVDQVVDGARSDIQKLRRLNNGQ